MSKTISVSTESYTIVRKVATDRGITTEEAADKVLAVGMTRLNAVANHYKNSKKKAKKAPKAKSRKVKAKAAAKPAKKTKTKAKRTTPVPAVIAAPAPVAAEAVTEVS